MYFNNFLETIKTSATNARKRCASRMCADPPPYKDLGPVNTSPLDSKDYKVIQLNNGLRVTLVSTCLHENPNKDTSVYHSFLSTKPQLETSSKSLDDDISSFNRIHLGINDYNKLGDSLPKPSSNTFKPKASQIFPSSECPSSEKAPKLLKCCKGLASICVAVGAGSSSELEHHDGLAHIVEHLIFLGSKHYPEPNTLFTKTYENGGLCNAYTNMEETVFFFSGNSGDRFDECVKILADGLTNPLFKESMIRKEIESIDSEYGIKQTCDATRIWDFFHSRAKRRHPFGKFTWGNKASLNQPDIREQVIEFKKKYYVSNNMTVCIHAPKRMEDLVKLALEHFSNIPSAAPGTESPQDELLKYGPPFEDDALHTCYFVTPLTFYTSMIISWALPAKFWKDYETKPLYYLKLMLENTSSTGLKHYLRMNKWMSEWNNLFVETTDHQNNGTVFCSLFCINVVLTDKGYRERAEVVKGVFSYLKMIKLGGIRPGFFEEMKRTASTKFHFQNWTNWLENASDIAVRMQYVKPADILTSKDLLTKWHPETIEECVKLLKPRTANFIFAARENLRICSKKALPCEIPFKMLKISEKFYQELEGIKVNSKDFGLPPDGTFLAKEIRINCATDAGSKPLGRYYESDKLIVSHLDDKMSPCLTPRLPSATYSIYFSSQVVSGLPTRVKQGLSDYWVRLLNDKITFQVGHQFDHLFTCELVVNDNGIAIHLEGPRCHLAELLTIFVEQVFDLERDGRLRDDTSIMEELRVDLIRQYRNDTFDVEILSQNMVTYLLESEHANLFEIRERLENTSVADGSMDRFIKTFRRRMLLVAELQGTVMQEDADFIVRLLAGGWDPRIQYGSGALLRELTWRPTVVPRGTSLLCVKALHPSYVTSVVTNFYQVDLWQGGRQDDAWLMLITLFRMMRQPLPTELRTNEQLGYTVRVRCNGQYNGPRGLLVIVYAHPHKHSTRHVDERIDNFFRQFLGCILRSPGIRKSIPDYVNPDALVRFYRDNFLKTGSNFRKLSVQVEGFTPGTKLPLKLQEKLTKSGEVSDGKDVGSLIPLVYIKPGNEETKRNLKKQAVQIISNVTTFKREMSILPARTD